MTRISNKVRIYGAILALIIVAALAIYLDSYSKKSVNISNKVLSYVQAIESDIAQLENEIAKSTFVPYIDNDVINNILQKIYRDYSEFFAYKEIQDDKYKRVLDLVQEQKRKFDQKQISIEKFKTLNVAVQNAIIFMPKFFLKIEQGLDLADEQHKRYIEELLTVMTQVFAIKSSLDFEQTPKIRENLSSFTVASNIPQVVLNEHKILFRYFDLFLNNFQTYIDTIKLILNNDDIALSKQILYNFDDVFTKQSSFITAITFFIILIFFVIVVYIITITLSSEKDRRKLRKLNDTFQDLIVQDTLTGLKNRKAFESEIGAFEKPILFIININKFRHINDFYGVKAGDFILTEVAKRLPQFIPSIYTYNLYRLGGDDFGLLLESDDVRNYELMALSLIESLDNEHFIYDVLEVDVSISIGMSSVTPLIEKADMALSFAKNSRLGYFLYNDEFNIDQDIKENLDTMKLVKQAIERDTLVPFFQPIINNATSEIEKYECLARIIQEDGTVLSPSFFINIAQNSKLYQSITLTMIDKSIEAFKDTTLEFSINLSAADMMDEKVISSIVEKLKTNKEAAKRLVFEILEDENIHNYESINNFIKEVRTFGCKVALDDFGAGFSNFAHVLNLNIDYIKFDGSLIKNLNRDKHSFLVTQTLVEFAKKANIKTIAEFVYAKEIQELVLELGIDYSQGYYFSMPHKDFFHYEL
jgi:diguanylate cyclase (GGDEF)-like protein